MPKQEIADVGKAIAMEQIRCAFDKRVAGSEAIAEFRKAAYLEAVIRDVRAEIVESPNAGVCTGKDDFDTMRRVAHSWTGRRAYRLRHALLVKFDQRDFLDRLAGAHEENVEQRQRSTHPAGAERHPHVVRLEKADCEDRAQGTFDMMQRFTDRAARQAQQIRDWTR